jgi:pyrroloquinoline quinone (PQQ) biosynthesis protein C
VNQPTGPTTIRRRFVQAKWLAAAIADLQEAWRWERHPFLQRWLVGELTAAELQMFAAEHHCAVVALAQAGRGAAAATEGLLGEQLERYAARQECSVELSCAFAVATGWGRSAWFFAQDPLDATVDCTRAWSGAGRSLADGLVALVTVEGALAPLAPRLLDALVLGYGFDEPGTRWFARCAERSGENAATIAAGLSSLLPLAAPERLLGQAERALRSYWRLLDDVQQLAATFA